MIKTFLQGFLIAVVLCSPAFLPVQARAEDTDLAYSISFTDEELDGLLAPVALYPDPLLAQLLPASTYPAEVADAAAWLDSGGDLSSLDEQSWDDSVKAVVRYPDLLRMMADNMDWTANLGDAFVNQPEEVADSIQRLRWRARAVGNLVSSDEQTVVIEGDYIRIVPAVPQYVYVPQYDASVVYVVAPAQGFPPFITFSMSFVIGGWLDMDFDWMHHCVIYHGWHRPGWVDHARPFVHVRDVNSDRDRSFINRTWRHDGSRIGPARYLASKPGGRDSVRFRRSVDATVRKTSQPGNVVRMVAPEGKTPAYGDRGTERRGAVNRRYARPNAGIRPRPSAPSRVVNRPQPVRSTNMGTSRNNPFPRVSRQPAAPDRRIVQRPAAVAPRVGTRADRPVAPQRGTVQQQGTPSVSSHSAPMTGSRENTSLRSRTGRQSQITGQTRISPSSRSSVRTPAGGRRDFDEQQRRRR